MDCLTKTERAYFNAAKSVSELSNHNQYKLGCVVVRGHRIISSGCNSTTKCDPIQARLDTDKYGCECPGKVHAEISALLPFIKSKEDISGASIYVHRRHKNGVLAKARPCSTCEAVIKSMGIKKVYYTVENGYACEKF